MVGASIATLLLVPSLLSLLSLHRISMLNKSKLRSLPQIPDGIVDFHTLHFSTSQGINTGIYLVSSKLDKNEDLQKNNLPQMVREISGLPVDMLADLVGVSRIAYHKVAR